MINENFIKNKKIIMIIAFFMIFSLVVGGTYAWLYNGVAITNGNYSTGTTCFNIEYDDTKNSLPITGTLFQSSGPKGGISGEMYIGISESCCAKTTTDANGNVVCNGYISGKGNIILNISEETGTKFFETVREHCEDSRTLKTLINVSDQATCETTENGVWVTTGTALKYAIYYGTDTLPSSVGYITASGIIDIYKDFELKVANSSLNSYYIYIWLDGELADNTYGNIPFSGYIYANAEQTE